MSITEEQILKEEVEKPSSSAVMNKYKMAGEIANDVIKEIISKCVDGARVYDLCQLGDRLITERCSRVFVKNKAIKKGIAFPTCVSPNHIICHFSPLKSESDNLIIKNNDLIKIELGVHVDGYPACVATSIVVGATKDNPVTGKIADAIQSAFTALDLSLKLFNKNKTNHHVTDLINDVAHDFHCLCLDGINSKSVDKGCLDGLKNVVHVPGDQNRREYEQVEWEDWDVFCLDVFMTEGSEGKPRQGTIRPTVFRRNRFAYSLKMKHSRELYSAVAAKYDEFAFSLASFEDETRAKLGVKECVDHGLFNPYPVLCDKNEAAVAHFKFTVIVTPNGPVKVVFPPFAQECVKSDYKLTNPKLIELLNQPLSQKKKITQ